MGKQWKQWETLFWGAPKSLYMVTFSHEIKRQLFLGRKILTNLDSVLKSRNITLPTKVHLIKVKVFLVVMYGCELDYKVEHQRIEGFKLWGWRRLLRVPRTASRSNPKRNQPWIFIGRTEAEALKLWPPDEKSQLTGQDPGAGKDWRQEEKGTTEDEMVGWHHWLDGHEFEQTARDSERQRSLLSNWTATVIKKKESKKDSIYNFCCWCFK